MKKIKKFMERIDWTAFVGKTFLIAVAIMGLMYGSMYSSERHAEMQTKAQAEEQRAEAEEKERRFLRVENARLEKENELLSKEPAEPTARRMEDTGFILVDSQNGLSQDDIVSYSIAENELRLHRDIFAGEIKGEEVLTTLDSYIEWLEGLKTRRFEDFLLSERIDDEIDMVIQEKELFEKEGVKTDSVRASVCEATSLYFQECRKNGVPFADAASQELAPELG